MGTRLIEGSDTPAPREPLPLCETTNTPRLPCALRCGTYPGNLGPCETWEEGGNGRCVYCDHGKQCHALSADQTPRASSEAVWDVLAKHAFLYSEDRAKCSCGWCGMSPATFNTSWMDFVEHVAAQTTPPPSEGRE
jgi:hypothetical protein